jgi:RHS repeat-associated protein
VLEQSCQSLPFGDALNCTGSTTAPTEHHFTGKERDAESGNDYFGARYYASSMGRFMSPDMSDDDDPDPVPFADKQNPQSLNLYAYVRGNPLTNTDPNGNDCVTQTRNSSTTETVTVTSGTCSGKVQDGQSQTYVDGTVTGVKAGADGHSIDIGYNSHDGQSSGVQNAGGAPMPDRPGLAPGWGNNAQGYATLAAADKLVTRATVVAGVAYGSVGAAIVATDLIAGGALHSLGNVATDLTEHAAERMAERGIDPNAARAAIETAKQTGNVVQTMGRYGPQVRYVANGLKVVVATSGANAGKIITVMWDTAGRWMQK